MVSIDFEHTTIEVLVKTFHCKNNGQALLQMSVYGK